MKKLSLPLNALLLSLAVSAGAEEPLQVSVHGVPPSFFEYLWKHDAEAHKFDQSGAWVPDQEADAIIVFLPRMQDEQFVPPDFQREHSNAMGITGLPFVRVQAGYYDGSTDRAVIFIAMDTLNERLDDEDLAPRPTRPGYVTCFAAGWVNRQYSPAEDRIGYDDLSEICRSWVNSGQ